MAQSVGPYTLGEPLGRGGMGMVFRAVDLRTGAEVALKVLTATDEQARKRLVREARALERLVHPNVVKILEAGEERGRPWIAVELVPGGSLEARLERLGPLPPAAAAQVALGVARALVHAHGLGVLHRDVKPGNVLLATNGEVKLGDFGLAGFHADLGVSKLTQAGALAGSPGWWAPEQATGAEVGPATDVYGLGATLYAALTGRPPIEGESFQEVLVATAEVDPAPPGVDATLDAVALRCLQKAPGDRYRSVEEVAAELERWLEGTPDVAPPRSRRLVVALGGLALVAVGAGAVAATRSPPPRPTPAPTPAPSPATRGPGPDRRAEVEALREQAMALFDRRELEAAIALLDSAVALDPRSAGAHADRALALLRSGGLARGRADADAAVALDPFLPLAWSRRSKARLVVDDYAGALADACVAVGLAPKSARHLADRGIVFTCLGAMSQASADFDAALAMDPTCAVAWELRGSQRTERGDHAGALLDLDRAIALDPLGADAFAVRGVVRSQLNDLAGALSDLDRAIALDPRHLEAHLNRGALRALQGQAEAALADYDRAVALAPGMLRPLTERALARAQAKRWAEALEDMDAALALEPRSAELFGRRAQIRWDAAAGAAHPDAQPALSDHDRAVGLAPEDPAHRSRRARLLATIGEHAAAIDDLDRCVQLAPTNASLRFERGEVHALARHRELAIADWEAAARLDPRLEEEVRYRILRMRE